VINILSGDNLHDRNVSGYSYLVWNIVRHSPKRSRYNPAPAKILEGYRHALPTSRGNLYLAVRKYLKLTRKPFADMLGINVASLRYRERTKQLYHPLEVLVLYQASGMTNDEFMQLLNDIA
jgi:hypothetical protein